MSKLKTVITIWLTACSILLGQTDRDGLMALFNATDGPNWLRNDNWGSTMPLNTWYGITTNGADRVIDINLYDFVAPGGIFTGGGNNLNGTLPEELGNLTALEGLSIAGNPNLTGPIPNTIGNLASLTNIFVADNSLSGPIPDTFGNLSNLRDARMGRNLFTGGIPNTFANLLNLERLLLDANQLSGTIPAFFGSLSDLTYLSLSQNQFTGTIPPELGNLNGLNGLNLSNNELTGGIPDNLGNITVMGVFNVSNNQLSGALPASLNQWTMVSIVNISNNSFEGDIPNFIFNGSFGTPSLYIDNNFFQFGDFETEFAYYNGPDLFVFVDNPQAPVNDVQNLSACLGSDITLTTTVSGDANVYQWSLNGVAIPNSNTPDLTITNFQNTNLGIYTCRISSTIVTDLVLERNPINVNLTNTPVANPVDDLYACDIENDGFETFNIDLASIENQVLGDQAELPVSYLDETGGSIVLTDTFTNTTAGEQIITVRVGDVNSCFDDTTFRLITISGPVAPILPDVSECSYTLPILENNASYFTEADGQGSRLTEGTVITSTQTVYVYIETIFEDIVCSNQSSFEITVDPLGCENENLDLLPAFFTPNNDGFNDLWDVSALAGTNTKVSIFNRYGKLLRQIDPNVSPGWDGRFNGTNLPSSDYWFKYLDSETGKMVTGNFTLKR